MLNCALAQRAGFVAVGLGSNRLRSETAAIAAVSVAAALLDKIRERRLIGAA